MEVADNDLLDFGATDSFTVLAVMRQWATPASDRIITKGLNASGSRYGIATSNTNAFNASLSDGANAGTTVNVSFTYGSVIVPVQVVDRAEQKNTLHLAGTTAEDGDISNVGSLANSAVLRVGSSSDSTAFADMEFLAVAIFRRALTSTEITALTTYFTNRIGE
jgi:hypothetical protein